VRVVLFVLLVAAIPTAAYYAIRWYAYDNWYISIQKNDIVIHQGHTSGVLWFQPRVVDKTGIKTSQVLSTGVAQIRSGVQEPSLAKAKSYVHNLADQYAAVEAAKKAKKAAEATTTTTVPGLTTPPAGTTSVPATTASPGVTTVPPATTATTAAATVPSASPATTAP
jgi:hypothetical protein